MNQAWLPLIIAASAAFGALLAAIAGARRQSEMEDDLRKQRDLTTTWYRRAVDAEKLIPQQIPLGAIQTAVADCADVPADKVGQVLEVLSAFPDWARALTLRRKTLDELADPHSARTYATHGIHEAREILRREREGQ